MNRGYTRENIIVGFPFETREDFNDTINLLREIQFDSIFAFAYSDRSSAPAASFSNQVAEEEIRERLNNLLELQEDYTEKKNKEQVGRILDVLVEGKSGKKRDGFDHAAKNMEQMVGRTESNKIVHFPSKDVIIGDIIKIKIENAYPHSLWGYPLGAQDK
jgi:tRNA-2-methylthio-N6-dimethylallyladenosine synthase